MKYQPCLACSGVTGAVDEDEDDGVGSAGAISLSWPLTAAMTATPTDASRTIGDVVAGAGTGDVFVTVGADGGTGTVVAGGVMRDILLVVVFGYTGERGLLDVGEVAVGKDTIICESERCAKQRK